MRSFILICTMLVAVVAPAAAQRRAPDAPTEHGGYGGVAVRFTQFSGDLGVLAGAQAQWIVNHSIAIGAAGYGLVTSHEPNSVPAGLNLLPQDFEVGMFYGGALASYIAAWDRKWHPVVDLLLGAGTVTVDQTRGDGPDYSSDNFFVIEPTLNAEVILVEYIRANIGLGYRFVGGIESWGFENGDISGASLSLVLKLGQF